MSSLTRRAARGWRMLAGNARTATAGLGLLMLACVLAAMAGPRVSAQMQTSALRAEIARAPAGTPTILASYGFSGAEPGVRVQSVFGISQIASEIRTALRKLPLAGPGTDLAAVTSPFITVSDDSPALSNADAHLELVYATQLGTYSHVLAGSLPGPVRKTVSKKRVTLYYLPIAVSRATASRFGLTVGTQLPVRLPPDLGYQVVLQVSGIVTPVQPDGPFWSYDPIQNAPFLIAPQFGQAYWEGGAFVNGAALPVIGSVLGLVQGTARWALPMRVGNLTADQGRALARALPAALTEDGNNLTPVSLDIDLSSPLQALLASFVQEADAVATVLSLLSISLAAICAVVLLLADWLLAEQRNGEFATLQARGASRRQLAWLALRGCMLPACAGGAIGAAVAIALTPGQGNALSWWLSASTLLAVLAGLPVLTMLRHRGLARASRRADRRVVGRLAIRRLVIEAVLVFGSAGGLATLRSRGLTPGAVDGYASLAPVLVAIPVAVLVLRCYPPLIRPLLRLTAARSGLTGFVGLARAARTSLGAALPIFALVLALTLVAFSGMVRGSVQSGDVDASWQQVGGDALVRAAAISPAAQQALARVPGVRHTVALSLTGATYPGLASAFGFGVVLADPAQYAPILAEMPGGAAQAAALSRAAAAGPRGQAGTTAAAPAPMLAPAGLAAGLGDTIDVGDSRQLVHVQLVGETAPIASITALTGDQYVVLPAAVLGKSAPPPSMLLVLGAGLNRRDLSRAVAKYLPGGSVTYRAAVLASLLNDPLKHGTDSAFALGTAEAAVLSLLVLLIALVIGARPREATLARLSTMGMSARQGRALVILESLPQIIAAVAGGVACAVLLAPLVGPALDLSSFTGTAASVPVRIEPFYLLGACAGLLVLAILTLATQARTAIRGAASALRIGE